MVSVLRTKVDYKFAGALASLVLLFGAGTV